MNEPAAFAAWGDLTLPLGTPHDREGAGDDHRAAHNICDHLMNLAGYEGLRKLRPDRRPFIFSRSGWVGMQRTAWTWTGDTETSWGMLAQTIPNASSRHLAHKYSLFRCRRRIRGMQSRSIRLCRDR